jgi:hypothetical protein
MHPEVFLAAVCALVWTAAALLNRWITRREGTAPTRMRRNDIECMRFDAMADYEAFYYRDQHGEPVELDTDAMIDALERALDALKRNDPKLVEREVEYALEKIRVA